MIHLLPVGQVAVTLLEKLRRPLEAVFGEEVEIGHRWELLEAAYAPERHQYLSPFLLDSLPSPEASQKVLAVVDVDLYTPGLNFVFGQADTARGVALISLGRLKQGFYGLTEDEGLPFQRVLTEAVHELGHLYGLAHCRQASCVMYFSNSLRDTDRKGADFCPACRKKIKADEPPGPPGQP